MMLEKLGWLVLRTTEISIFGYFFYVSIYNLILSIFGFAKPKLLFTTKGVSKKKIVVLIPAYKEDAVILQTVDQILEANYPKDLLELVVIADSMQGKTISKLSSLPIKLVRVSFEQSTKVKAINSCLEQINFDADIMVILDADNEIEPEFLMKVNALFNEDYNAIQGRRIIKNPKNNWTFLDDLSEQINNHINRKGSCAIGGSSSIAGSGFAVGFDVGKEVFRSLSSVGGFDKEFELELLKRGVKTSYVEGLKIYDEKVANNQVFKKQRTRWIASQYAFLRKYLIMGILAFFRRDYSFFNSSILRNMQLPRLLNLGLFTSIFLIVLLFSGHTKIPVSMWAITYGLFVVAILLAIPKRFYNYQLLQSMLILPRIFMQMFLILFKLKGANKNFIHTPHGTIVKNDPS